MGLLIKRSLFAVMFIALILAGLCAFLLSSQVGARFVLSAGANAVDGLAFDEVRGSLTGPLVLLGLRYSTPDMSLTARQLQLEWQPGKLLQREVSITGLRVHDIGVELPETAPETEQAPFTGVVLPESLPLPLTVVLHHVSFTNILVQTSSNQVQISEVALAARLEPSSGVIGSEAAPNSSASVEWSDLRVDASDENTASIVSDSGQLQVKGSTQSHRSVGKAALIWNGEEEVHLSFNGQGDQRELTLTTLAGSLFGGTIQGKGHVDWSQGFTASIALEGDQFNPAQFDERVPGILGFSMRMALADGALNLQQLKLFGLLREQAIELEAAGDYAQGSARIASLAGRVGDSRFSASGEVADTMDFQWDVDSPDLGVFLPELAGQLRSAGTLRGSREQPVLNGSFDLQGARYTRFSAESVTANVALDLMGVKAQQNQQSTIQLKAVGLQLGETAVSLAEATLIGAVASHNLAIELASDAGNVTANLTGAYRDGTWSGTWKRGELAPLAMPRWSLEQPQPITLSASSQSVERGCWHVVDVNGGANGDTNDDSGDVDNAAGHKGRACFSLARTNQNTQVDFRLESLPLDYFDTAVPEDLSMLGTISASGSAEQKGEGALQIIAQLQTSPTRLFRRGGIAGASSLPQSLELEPSVASVKGSTDALHAKVQLPFSAGGGLSGDITIKNLLTPSASALGGTLVAKLPELSFLSLLSPEIESVTGAGAVDVQLAGTLTAPEPRGEMRITDMQVVLVTPGLSLDTLSLTVLGDAGGNINLKGSAQSDGGTLQFEGKGLIAPTSGPAAGGLELVRFDGRIEGSQFQFWNTPDALVWGSPELTLRAVNNELHIAGEVVVPKASITPTQLPPSAVSPSADQVIVNADPDTLVQNSVAATPLDVFASLRLSLGNEVNIDGFGFTGGLAGDLGIELAPGKPVLASGELNVVDGEYRAFGQGLVVERGQLLFAGGDIENPGLNVRAQRRPAADVVVGVNVTGQLQKPNLQVFSEPAMSSSNQLAWLVLGRPFETTSGAETDYIAQAALLLGIQGGDYLAKSFGDKLGLDTVGIETGSGEAGAASDVNQAALVVGKYLTPKLYISYGVGLLESISTVKLRYQMSDRWNLVTESSPIASGGDVNFTIER
ncbi:MAG: translocation/assembly module TamB domain-containing protein [Halioglobus sp.]